jgi:FkbM family methyltransferase
LIHLRNLAGRLQRRFAQNRLTAQLALKIRNQTHCIIGYALGEDAEVTDENNSEKWLIREFGRFSTVFIDVGANRGDWTALMLKETKGPTGLLFEPVPELATELKRRFENERGIKVINAAVSDAPGEREFFIEPGDAKTSSLARGATSSRSRTCVVRVATLDVATEQAGLKAIDFLKIDAEGYDLNVLEGAQGLLAAQCIKLLQFEYGPAWVHANNTLVTALSLLQRYDYATYLLRKNALYTFNYHKYREYFGYSNFVSVSREFRDRVAPLVRGEV